MVKPGYRTSEFWFTAVSFIFSGLYLIGIITDSGQKEELIGNVSHAVESCILIGGQLAILWKYINSRKEVKKSYWSSQKSPEIEVIEVVNNDNPKSTKPTSNKNRGRKTNSESKRKSTKRKTSGDK
jgi:hypothetical protein